MRGKENRPGRGRSIGLWVLAFVLMLSAGVYQRYTGPTYKLRGSYSAGEEVIKYRLIRSAYSTSDTVVTVPAPAGAAGDLVYRRYPTDDDFTRVPMVRRGEELVATLPAQPPAGKLEYHLGKGRGQTLPGLAKRRGSRGNSGGWACERKNRIAHRDTPGIQSCETLCPRSPHTKAG